MDFVNNPLSLLLFIINIYTCTSNAINNKVKQTCFLNEKNKQKKKTTMKTTGPTYTVTS